MSFTISTYDMHEPPNKIGKTLGIAVGTYTGQLVDGTSIVDPDILVESAGVPGGNYVYIQAFERYYFIKDKVSVKNGFWRLQMHVDVLMTYSTPILASTVILARNTSNYNQMLNDSEFKIQENPIIMTKTFSSGFNTGAASYVLDLVGVSVPVS